MTYCVGMCLAEGAVLMADTRTNAGLDNIATFSKMHVFEAPGERVVVLMTAGNLAITQSVISLVSEGLENHETGERETLYDMASMFDTARFVGRAIRDVYDKDAQALEQRGVNFEASIIVAGQLHGRRMRMFQIYTAAISSRARRTRRSCKSASTNTASRSSTACANTTRLCATPYRWRPSRWIQPCARTSPSARRSIWL